MSRTETNKEICRRVVAEAVNSGDPEAFRPFLADGYARHSQATTEGPEIRGVDAMIEFLGGMYRAFPDWHEEIRLMVAEGDKVAYLTVGRGTHAGPMGDIPATGRTLELETFIIQRLEDGKIAETWVGWDNLAALAQLGLMPGPEDGS